MKKNSAVFVPLTSAETENDFKAFRHILPALSDWWAIGYRIVICRYCRSNEDVGQIEDGIFDLDIVKVCLERGFEPLALITFRSAAKPEVIWDTARRYSIFLRGSVLMFRSEFPANHAIRTAGVHRKIPFGHGPDENRQRRA